MKDVLMKVLEEVQPEAATLLFLEMNVSQRPAKAGADRKESGQAWEPAEPDGPESECHAARPGARSAVLQRVPFVQRHFLRPAADAAAPIEEAEEELPPPELRGLLVAEHRRSVPAWEQRPRAMARRKLRLRVLARSPFPSISSEAIRSIPRSAGA
jgi:hypothetical protein